MAFVAMSVDHEAMGKVVLKELARFHGLDDVTMLEYTCDYRGQQIKLTHRRYKPNRLRAAITSVIHRLLSFVRRWHLAELINWAGVKQ